MKSLLKALGLPTENGNGHELGCRCEACAELSERNMREMRRRAQAGEEPKTVGELIAWMRRKREEQ